MTNSLAAKLAAQHALLKADPNAAPLTAAESTLDPFALNTATGPVTGAAEVFANPGEPFSAAPDFSHVEAPRGSFLAQRLPYLILANGAKVMPTDGYFEPKSQEEFDMLEYFAKQNNGLVELVE